MCGYGIGGEWQCSGIRSEKESEPRAAVRTGSRLLLLLVILDLPASPKAHDIASGLAYLHSLEPPVCHGDIKPVSLLVFSLDTGFSDEALQENALVNKVEKAVICDFGLAKTLGDSPSGLTTTAQPFTPHYASPEVLQDATVRTLPSDVWSWGCLVYQVCVYCICRLNRSTLIMRKAHSGQGTLFQHASWRHLRGSYWWSTSG